MNYFILTSKKNKAILVTKSYLECHEFITKNHDTRVRQLDYKATPKLLSKDDFLRKFLKNTQDQTRFFEIAEIMVKGQSNMIPFLNSVGLLEKYKAYKTKIKSVL